MVLNNRLITLREQNWPDKSYRVNVPLVKNICRIVYDFFQDLWTFLMIWKILLWILQMLQK